MRRECFTTWESRTLKLEAWRGSSDDEIPIRWRGKRRNHPLSPPLSQPHLLQLPSSHLSNKHNTTMASTTAQRRLLQESRLLTNNPPEGITAGPVSEDDLLYWEALIQGPEGTPFEGGVFPAE